jgi:DNA modification methylase
LLASHPTIKPLALCSDAILDCTNRGEIILDSFAGSGTTILAAEATGRRCRAIELDPLYVDVALRRVRSEAGIVPVLEKSGATLNQLEAHLGSSRVDHG